MPDAGGVAEALLRRCASHGLAAPSMGAIVPETATRVLLLNALSPCASTAGANAIVFETFSVLRALGQSHRTRPVELFVAQALGGDFGFVTNPADRAVLGAVAGIAKSAAREWPHATVRVVDLPAAATTEELAEKVGGELSVAGPEIEVGLAANGQRITPRLVPAITCGAATFAPKSGDVWIVSGGARGVTAACLQALAQRAPLRFALLGRTPIDEPEVSAAGGRTTDAELKRALLGDARTRGVKLTPPQLQRQVGGILAAREARAACEALRATGAEVRYFAIDVADAKAVAHTVAEVRQQWGPICGVVHAAGVLADKVLHEKTDEQFLSVYRTKVDGFHALLAATRDDPLTALGCFSSVAGRAGNAGQSDYAAANEALNKLCQAEQHCRGAGCVVRAINWGPWDGGMVSPGLKTHFAAMGVALIPIAGGAEVFADIMTGVRPTTVECVVGAAALAEAAAGLEKVQPSGGRSS